MKKVNKYRKWIKPFVIITILATSSVLTLTHLWHDFFPDIPMYGGYKFGIHYLIITFCLAIFIFSQRIENKFSSNLIGIISLGFAMLNISFIAYIQRWVLFPLEIFLEFKSFILYMLLDYITLVLILGLLIYQIVSVSKYFWKDRTLK